MTGRAGRTAVVKVGGSLYDLPDLGQRLRQWLRHYPVRNILVIPGGGPLLDVLRGLDKVHGLGEEASHWLALEALRVNAHFLKRILPGSAVIHHLDERLPLFCAGVPAIVDMLSFARDDSRRSGTLPELWAVTSDSLAVRVAAVAAAHEVVLLKSRSIPAADNWEEAARQGWVDAYFPEALRQHRQPLSVRAVDLRHLDPALHSRE